jgi:hypothetical protein
LRLAARRLPLDADVVRRLDEIDRTERVVDFSGAPWNDGGS